MSRNRKFQEVKVDSLKFMFPYDWHVLKYDDCNFYTKNHTEGIKAVDLLALNSDGTRLFMIEAKDFRQIQAQGLSFKNIEVVEEVAKKVKHTLGFLLCAHLSQYRELDIYYDFLIQNKHSVFIILHMERDGALKAMRPTLLAKLEAKLNCLAGKHIKFNIYDAELLNEAFEQDQQEKDWWYVNP